jgi:hypothetical protein
LLDVRSSYFSPSLRLNFSGAGTYVVHFHRVALVLLKPESPTPISYFGGEMPGFAYSGAPGRSRSIGPTHAQNMIADPQFTSFVGDGPELDKWLSVTTGLTINQVPIRSARFSGDVVDGALYHKATKDNTATSRQMGVLPLSTDGNAGFYVVEGRRYRFSALVELLTKPATGNVTVSISWLDAAGAQIVAHNSDPLPLGRSEPDVASVEQTAPVGAVDALLLVWNVATTTANAVLEIVVSDPCFVDVTDWDPGNFYGVGDAAEETGVYRRIPRPFLLQGVRKTSDMKAPEQQSRSRAWRDFTMSLRASDPRIYCLDERRQSVRLPAVATVGFVSATGTSFATGSTPPPVPAGFTYEGNTSTTSVRWTTNTGPPTGSGVT